MQIDIRQLRYAVATAEARSFARAAEVLLTKQSTLSRRVMQLEQALGIKLFERTTRGAEPTTSGLAFLEVARRIVTDIDNLKTTARAVSYGEQGRLAVGFMGSLMAGKLKLTFSDYLNRYPDVQFDGIEAGAEKLFRSLEARSIDIVVAPVGLERAGIAFQRLWSERLIVALPLDHRLLANERIYWQDLRREVMVVPQSGVGPVLANMLSSRLSEQGYRPNVIEQDTSLESVISMVSARRFLAVATESSQATDWPGVEFRDIYDANGLSRLEYGLYWREGNDNPALRHFFGLVQERYSW